MDKTDKPLHKQPPFLATSSTSPQDHPTERTEEATSSAPAQDHPTKRTEEDDTDSLFAGLFGESIQDLHKTSQEPSPRQTLQPTLPAPLSKPRSEAPSPPPRSDHSEGSLQDLIAVLEQDISRLRKERIAISPERTEAGASSRLASTHSSERTEAGASSRLVSTATAKETPPHAGRLLDLLDQPSETKEGAVSPRPPTQPSTDQMSSFLRPLSPPAQAPHFSETPTDTSREGPAYKEASTPVDQRKHPILAGPKQTSPESGLHQQAEEIEALLSQHDNKAFDAPWRALRALLRFLDQKGYPARALPTSRYLFAWPTWSWLFVMAWFALSFPVLGVWAQAGASLALGIWLLEQSLGWSLSAMLLPMRAKASIHIAPSVSQIAEGSSPQGAESSIVQGVESSTVQGGEEVAGSPDIIVAVPYRGGDIEPGIPQTWLRKLPRSWRFLEYVNSPRVWGIAGAVLWLMLIGTSPAHRAAVIVTGLCSLMFASLMGVMAWSFYRSPRSRSPAWSLALSLQIYEQARKQAPAARIHLVWFDAQEGLCAGEHLLQEEIFAAARKAPLWLGLAPISPTDKELVLVESETYLQSRGLHPQIAQLLLEEKASQPEHCRLKTRLWTWPIRLQKRPLLLLGSREALGLLETQAHETSSSVALALASSKDEPVFRIDGTSDGVDNQARPETAGQNVSLMLSETTEQGGFSVREAVSSQQEPVGAEISVRVQSFLRSFLKDWQARRAHSPWLSIVVCLLGVGLSGVPCAASTRCAEAYQRQATRCEADYSRRNGICGIGIETKSRCAQQEKQGVLRCKALFDRVKGECTLRSLREEQRSACREKAEAVRQGCQTPRYLKETCGQGSRSCKAGCGKEDIACEDRCEAQQIRCLREAEERWIRCQRDARSSEERCRRSAQDQELQRVYRCLQESAKARLECQRSKRDERLLCEDALEDQARKCRRICWDERKSCYEAALQKRLRCRE